MIQIKRFQRPDHAESTLLPFTPYGKALDAITETFTPSATTSTFAKAKFKYAKAKSFFAKAYASSYKGRGVVK